MADRKLPVSLVIVAVLFIIGGVSAVLEMIVALVHGRLSINFGVLGIFVGVGLLRLSRGWRTCGLVLIWIGLILMPLVIVLMLGASRPITFNVLGQPVGTIGKGLALLFALPLVVLTIWMYRVLTRPDVRSLFGLAK